MADYYVDPSLGTDSGSGTVGDPWGHTGNEIQKALDNITQGAQGDNIHVKSTGTVSFSGSNLDFTSYTNPGIEQPLCISGYTSAAWDGGIGTIDLGGGSTFVASSIDGMMWSDLDISGGTGSHQIVADNNNTVFRCKLDGGAASGGCSFDNNSHVIGCEITNVSGTLIHTNSGIVAWNYCTQGSNNGGIVVDSAQVIGNLVVVTHTNDRGAIALQQDRSWAMGNIVYSSVASQGEAFLVTSAAETSVLMNNYAEGFSGTGGDGFNVASGSVVNIYKNNRWFNCTNGETLSGTVILDDDNSATTASGLRNAGTDYTLTAELIGNGFPSGFLNLSNNIVNMDIGVPGFFQRPVRAPRMQTVY